MLSKHLIPIALILLTSSLYGGSAVTVSIDASKQGATIPKEIFGNNVAWSRMNNFYKSSDSLPEPMMKSFLEMGVPSNRYPGGCAADLFTFEDAIGPKSSRKIMWYNSVKPPSTKLGVCYFGVDEFLQLCEKLGSEPVITLQFRHRDGKIRPTKANWVSSGAGDTVTLKLFAPRDGFYRIRPRIKTGTPHDIKMLVGEYSFDLDKAKMSLDYCKKYPVVSVNGQSMGMLESNVVWLAYGEHELLVSVNQPELYVDYVELVEFNHDNSVKRAMAWVAYCNGSPDDNTLIGQDQAGIDWKTVGYWATLRARPDYGNHPESYCVKYWEVGNEAWGPDPYGSLKIRDPRLYADGWIDYNSAILKIDPTLSVSICSNTPDSQGIKIKWADELIKRIGNKSNLIHYHLYYPWDQSTTDPLKLYQGAALASSGSQTWLDFYRATIKKYHPEMLGKLKSGISEWAPAFWWGGWSQDWTVRMAGVLATADILGTFTHNTDLIGTAQFWRLYTDNVCVYQAGTGANAPDGFYKHGLYEVFSLYNNQYGHTLLPVEVKNSPAFDYPGWGRAISKGSYPYITAYASRDETAVYAVIINKDWENAHVVDLTFSKVELADKATTRLISAPGESPAYTAINTQDKQVITTAFGQLPVNSNGLSFEMPPVSVLGVKIPLKTPSAKVWSRWAGDVATVRRDPGRRDSITIASEGSMMLGEPGDSIVFPFRLEPNHVSVKLYVKGKCDVRIAGSKLKGAFSQGIVSFSTNGLTNERHYLLITAKAPGVRVQGIEVCYGN